MQFARKLGCIMINGKKNIEMESIPSVSNAAAAGQIVSWRHLGYYLFVPLAVALYAGLNNWKMIGIAGLPASIIFYMAHSLLPWWTTCLSTTALMKALNRWKPPWLVLLILGHTMGCLIVLPYSNWLTGLYAERWPELVLGAETGSVLSMAFLKYWLQAGVIWIGINFVFDRFIGLPLYRYVIPRGFETLGPVHRANTESGWGVRPPGFVERLPAALQPEDVLAIKAEQHYIKVFSPDKEYMVLYRFSDAVREIDESLGMQVHRSYWVNTGAIKSIHARAKDFTLRIKSDTDIPVSTPYQGMVRELAKKARIPQRG